MILRTIYCSVHRCPRVYTEKKFNEGFPGWGHINGIYNDQTEEDIAHLCPDHLEKIKGVLNNDLD